MKIVPGYCTLKNSHKHKVVIYIDGAAKGNPGPAGIGALLKDEKGVIISEISKFIGEATNNIAEYSALLEALRESISLGFKYIEIRSDSELLIKQLKGEYKVKSSNLRFLFENAILLLNNFEKIEVNHIPREENKDADRLANKAVNLSGFNKIF